MSHIDGKSEAEPDLREMAEALEQVRTVVQDLKHDIRMLKVGLDRQARKLDRLAASQDARGVGFGDQPSRGAGEPGDREQPD